MRETSFAFLGDLMPGGLLHYSNNKFISDDVLMYLKSFDFRIATLECALGDDLEFYQSHMTEQGRNKNIIYAKNSDIKKLKQLNIDVVTIANNHIFDLGEKGLLNTLNILKENNIQFCGAGRDIKEASKPAIIEHNGKSYAFIGCAEIIPSSPNPAEENKAGFNPLDIQQISIDIKQAKKTYDYVFVLPHWGKEYIFLPPPELKEMAYEMILAGADGVFGGHPHVVQPSITYRKKPIFFSMGNFLFPDRYVQPPAPTYYPEDPEKLKNIESSNSPFCNEITLKTWPTIARLGIIVDVLVSNVIKVDTRFVHFNQNKRIEFSTQKKTPFKFLIGKLILRSFLYSVFLQLNDIKNKIIH